MVSASAEKMIQSISGSVEELEIRLDSHLSPRRKQDTKNKLESANKL